jgi:hypothetical protein
MLNFSSFLGLLIESIITADHEKTGQVVFVIGDPRQSKLLDKHLWGNRYDYQDFSKDRLVMRNMLGKRNQLVGQLVLKIKQFMKKKLPKEDHDILSQWFEEQNTYVSWSQVIEELPGLLKPIKKQAYVLLDLLDRLFLLTPKFLKTFSKTPGEHLPNLKINLKNKNDPYFDIIVSFLKQKGYKNEHLHLIVITSREAEEVLLWIKPRFDDMTGEVWLAQPMDQEQATTKTQYQHQQQNLRLQYQQIRKKSSNPYGGH